jgi:hypothetical protein
MKKQIISEDEISEDAFIDLTNRIQKLETPHRNRIYNSFYLNLVF